MAHKSNFTHDLSLEEWNVSGKEWLQTHNKHWDGIASGAVVFSSDNRVLLVQRSADDSMPNLWETPGGAVDTSDGTILEGCARELREETGLTAVRFVRRVTEGAEGDEYTVFTNSRGTKVFCKFVFEVEVPDDEEVVLDPVEHQGWVWATEEEVRKGKVGDGDGGEGVPIKLTTPHVMRLVMEAFRLRKEDGKKES